MSGSAADVDVSALIEVTKNMVPDSEGGSTAVVTVDFQVEASVSLEGGITNANFAEKADSIRRSIALALDIPIDLVQNVVILATSASSRRVLMQDSPTSDAVDVGYTVVGIKDGSEADKLASKTKAVVEDNTLAEKVGQEANVVVTVKVKEAPKMAAKVMIEKTVVEATKGSTSKGVEVEQMLKASVDSGDFQAKLVEKSPAAAATLTVEKVSSTVEVVQSPPPPPPPPPPVPTPVQPPFVSDSPPLKTQVWSDLPPPPPPLISSVGGGGGGGGDIMTIIIIAVAVLLASMGIAAVWVARSRRGRRNVQQGEESKRQQQPATPVMASTPTFAHTSILPHEGERRGSTFEPPMADLSDRSDDSESDDEEPPLSLKVTQQFPERRATSFLPPLQQGGKLPQLPASSSMPALRTGRRA